LSEAPNVQPKHATEAGELVRLYLGRDRYDLARQVVTNYRRSRSTDDERFGRLDEYLSRITIHAERAILGESVEWLLAARVLRELQDSVGRGVESLARNPKAVWDIRIVELPVCAITINLLESRGVELMRQLLAKSPGDLLAIPGLGEKRLDELLVAVLGFAGDLTHNSNRGQYANYVTPAWRYAIENGEFRR
jgi:hypothetical protein